MAGEDVGEDEGGEVGEDLLARVGRVDASGPEFSPLLHGSGLESASGHTGLGDTIGCNDKEVLSTC